ncbi:IncL/M type plasmid replication protein RepC [Klebsiella pneumoniae]|uniref:IncL/M type plasmid replication protein RepC n=1 Tax=Klebsiella pneumoniae TaxID=573 RepID=UPI001FF06C39|nr:IncL/M type plasmid replication protein RepC [Klebsiella pneumoniae]
MFTLLPNRLKRRFFHVYSGGYSRMLWEEVVNRVTERQEQKSNPEFQREYRNRIRETHDQLNLYLPKDAKRMLIEITKVKKLTQAEVIEFLVKSYYDGLKFDDSEE